MKEVEHMMPRDGSVLLLAIKGEHLETGKTVVHLVHAYREMAGLGAVRLMDRTITSAGQKSYSSLAELAERYPVQSYIPFRGAVLHNVYVRSFLRDIPRLVIPVPAVVGAC
jgi:hypothetical protein